MRTLQEGGQYHVLGQSTAYTLDTDEEEDKEDAACSMVLGKDADGGLVHQCHEDHELGDCRER